jgi:signal transduction histidine kinase
MKNIAIRTLVIGHLLTLATVIFCICYQQAWNDYFMVLNWILSSNVSFEVKRSHRVGYKRLMKSQEQQELAIFRSKQVELLKQEQERLRQEKVIHEMAEEARRSSDALKSKCSLVRHIGHEIRTPLNVVGVGVDLLIKDLAPYVSALPDGMMDIVYGIQEASTASLEVINELLMFEKLAAGMTTLECVPTHVVPFLEQAMKQHLLPARAKDISFELVPSSVITNHVAINVDPLKLATVFRNLFSNAIKFTR